MGPFGMPEILIVVLVLFLLFGATRLPQLAKSLGQSKKAFKEGLRDAEEEEKSEQKKIDSAAPAPQVNPVGDEAFADEMRRRSEAKTP